jgi:DNA-binding beta-propeller fold protein YncE
MSRSSTATLILLGLCGLLTLGVGAAWEPGRKSATEPAVPPRILPGVQPSGEIRLPNQWSLRPVGRQLLLGDFPVNLALHPDGHYLAALHAGYGTHEIIIVDIQNRRQRIVSRVSLPQTFYGLCFSPDGKTLYASGAEYETVHRFTFDRGLLSDPRPGHKTLFVAGTWGDAVRLVPLDTPEKRQNVALGKESYPYACLPEPGGKRLFVSLWGTTAVAVIDIAEAKVLATWPTESHPT